MALKKRLKEISNGKVESGKALLMSLPALFADTNLTDGLEKSKNKQSEIFNVLERSERSFGRAKKQVA